MGDPRVASTPPPAQTRARLRIVRESTAVRNACAACSVCGLAPLTRRGAR